MRHFIVECNAVLFTRPEQAFQPFLVEPDSEVLFLCRNYESGLALFDTPQIFDLGVIDVGASCLSEFAEMEGEVCRIEKCFEGNRFARLLLYK
ncbi:MAG: hypothetical protein K9L68_04675 [Spirochaetales bacterium]|nr:hypothetical protein [Spirochaetales bacterium]MCF7937872.1 hypothetical protein [Spirochaetales bacterium]